MKYIVFIGIGFLLLGCAQKKELEVVHECPPPIIKEVKVESIKIVERIVEVEKKEEEVVANTDLADLVTIPQNIEFFTEYIKNDSYMVHTNYEEAFFSTWNIDKPSQSLEDVQWPFKAFNVKTSYGENLLPMKQTFFDEMLEKSNFADYLKSSKKGLILTYTNIRAFPTFRPLLRDPSLAGEGFPFDYLQNSSVNANTPVFISHYSQDKQWVFIFSRFTYGWVKNDNVVIIEDKYAALWKNAKQIHILKEGISLFTSKGDALFDTRIGMTFALIEEDALSYTVLGVSKYKNDEAMYHKVKIAKEYASENLLALNTKNINLVVNEVSKTNYGWGGVYGQRDCSSTLMDLYAPFGIALPRNSSKQAEIGLVIDLSTLSNEEKLHAIKDKAIPFETLLYKHGHIMLYVGTYNDDVIVFHNTWGIKTKNGKKEGRFIIGKPIFSTLHIGSELKNYDEDAQLLRNIKSMNIFTR